MAGATTVTEDVPRAVTRLLEPGERVVWHGPARAYNAVLDAGVALIGRLVVPLILLLLIWSLVSPEERRVLIETIREEAWTRAVPLAELRLLALLLAGLLAINMIGGVVGILVRLAAGLGRAIRTHYAITDRRVLIVDGGHAVSLKRLPVLRVVPGPLGDDLRFGVGAGFDGLADADTVKRMLLPFLATREGSGPVSPWSTSSRRAT